MTNVSHNGIYSSQGEAALTTSLLDHQYDLLMSSERFGGIRKVVDIVSKYNLAYEPLFDMIEKLRHDDTNGLVALSDVKLNQVPTAVQMAEELLPHLNEILQHSNNTTHSVGKGIESMTEPNGENTTSIKNKSKPSRTRTPTGQNHYKLTQQLVCELFPEMDNRVRIATYTSVYKHTQCHNVITTWLVANGFTGKNPEHKGEPFNHQFRTTFAPKFKAELSQIYAIFYQLKDVTDVLHVTEQLPSIMAGVVGEK